MPTRRTTTLALLTGLIAVAAPWAGAPAAAAVLVEGKPFDERLLLDGRTLVLNGTGVRAVAWLKGYAAGLYLAERADSARAVQAVPGPKRLRMVMLQEAAAVEFTKAFDKGVSRNAPPDELPRLRERMDRFKRLIDAVGKVRKGDVVDLDFDPARGTVFIVNGTLRGEPIPGDDFYSALLRSFVGDRPYDQRLRAGLLGQKR
jgi:hypothetical protein